MDAHFRLLTSAELELPLRPLPSSFGAVVRIQKPLSPGDVKRQTRRAVELREKVRSGPPGAKITKLFFTTRWPGTVGPKALLLHFTCPTLALPTWRHLLTAPIGEWDDLHLFDAVGLLAYSTRHEGEVGVRGEGAFETSPGDELDPSVFAFLTGP